MKLSNYWLNRRRDDILAVIVLYARWQCKDVRKLTSSEIRYVIDAMTKN